MVSADAGKMKIEGLADAESFVWKIGFSKKGNLSENLKNTVSLLPTTAACQENTHESWQCKNCQGSENKKLANLKMIFNITTCGKWAGAKFDVGL